MFSEKGVWIVFNATRDGFPWENQSNPFSYVCPQCVGTFPLFAVVRPLSGYIAYAIRLI